MNDLLKADFYALKKNKLTYILLAICVGLPILTVALYIGIEKIMASEILAEVGFSGSGLFNGRLIMFSNFSLSNNVGLIIPIFAGLFTVSDIRHGTVRNKIIC